jgi:hypothetical protein
MRTLKAVLWGFLITTALILAGGWAARVLLIPTIRGEYFIGPLAGGLLAILYTGTAITIGAYVATRIHDANETISGFIVAQAFFGFGLIREFWNVGSSWYSATAILLVIPCAIIGQILARRLGRNKLVGAMTYQ